MRGLFVRDDPGAVTDCVTGYTWVFDATDRVLKCWDGSAWRHSCLTQYLVPVSDGNTFIAVPDGAGTAAQVLTSHGAGAEPPFQTAAGAAGGGVRTPARGGYRPRHYDGRRRRRELPRDDHESRAPESHGGAHQADRCGVGGGHESGRALLGRRRHQHVVSRVPDPAQRHRRGGCRLRYLGDGGEHPGEL